MDSECHLDGDRERALQKVPRFFQLKARSGLEIEDPWKAWFGLLPSTLSILQHQGHALEGGHTEGNGAVEE